ncbi:MAG: copper amine oxidase N-terminal domain-containing protein [Defluviitaleaceae bacterium]|nr:copper amine oxidase N-terminal domain-containing protein [Defluviitaleaceae bacterium]
MKKIIGIVLCAAMFAGLVGGLTAAEQPEISVYLNGERIELDAPPQIIDNHPLVPMRAIFEALGFRVEWDGETQKIYAYRIAGDHPTEETRFVFDLLIEMQIGNPILTTGWAIPALWMEEHTTLDAPPQMVNNRIFVPLNAVSEATGADVVWCEGTRTVTITTQARQHHE